MRGFSRYFAYLPRKIRRGSMAMWELQLQRLQKLLRRAGSEVPHFRRRFQEVKFMPEQLLALADLERLPESSKSELQTVPVDDLVSERYSRDRLILRNTTGSTGMPFKIYRTWAEERILGTYRRRALRNWGMKLRDIHVDLEEIEAHHANDSRHLHEFLMRIGFFRQYRLDATRQPEDLFRQLEVLKPDVMTGYSASVALLAQWMIENRCNSLRPRFIAVHSEVLTAQMRNQVETAFQCPVYVIYDANECNLIASECPETGHLHVCDDSVLVEVVRNGKVVEQGEEGEVLLTSLHSYAQPFIRFRVGDLATRGYDRCPCGAPYSTIEKVHGRMFDYFPLSDGRMLHPYRILEHLGDKNAWIRQYRLVQEKQDLVRLYVVSAGVANEKDMDAIRERVGKELGDAARFEIRIVDQLDNEGRSKFRVCFSRLASEYEKMGPDSQAAV